MPFSSGDSSLSAAPVTLHSLLQSVANGTMATLIDLPGQCIDKERVVHYLAEFAIRHPGRIEEWAAAVGTKIQRLIATFAYSRFLSEELLQHPDWLDEIPDPARMLIVAAYTERIRNFLNVAESPMPRALDLATLRRREIFRIFLRDVLGLATLAEITAELSHLADAILQKTLSGVLTQLIQRYGRPSDGAEADEYSSFCVIALGKLGGGELNYSSDIDL